MYWQVNFNYVCNYLMQVKEKTEVMSDCKYTAQVCSAVLWINPSQLINQGPYCQCPDCQVLWRSEDLQSLTWYHYERSTSQC